MSSSAPPHILPVLPSPGATAGTSATPGISRRSALQGLVAGLGLTAGSTTADADVHDHPLAAHIVQRRATPPATTPATPKFFDAHQFATLGVVSELIVPGSVASGSPAYIDSVLAVEHDDVRIAVVSALSALDAAARDAHRATFRTLKAPQQIAILESLTRPLVTLKTWVAGAHYSSEAGLKSLGFDGMVFFQEFPACQHAEGHA